MGHRHPSPHRGSPVPLPVEPGAPGRRGHRARDRDGGRGSGPHRGGARGSGRGAAGPLPRAAGGRAGDRARRPHHPRGRSTARHPGRHRQDPDDAGPYPTPRSPRMTDADRPPPAHRGWHVPPALLARFADDPRAVDDITAASIDAPLPACADCRQRLSAAAAPTLAATSWAAVADRIDRPRPTVLERLLHRLGFGTGTTRLLAATPALQAAGLATVAVLPATAGVLSRTAGADGPFLVLAPLVPLAAGAVSFASAAA